MYFCIFIFALLHLCLLPPLVLFHFHKSSFSSQTLLWLCYQVCALGMCVCLCLCANKHASLEGRHLGTRLCKNRPQTQPTLWLLGCIASITPRFLQEEVSHKMQAQFTAVDLTSIPCDYKKAECRAQQWERYRLQHSVYFQVTSVRCLFWFFFFFSNMNCPEAEAFHAYPL